MTPPGQRPEAAVLLDANVLIALTDADHVHHRQGTLATLDRALAALHADVSELVVA